MLAGLLVFTPLAGLTVFFARRSGSWSTGAVGAFLTWAAVLFAVSELLGFGHLLRLGPVLGFWLLANAFVGAALWSDLHTRPLPPFALPRDLLSRVFVVLICLLLVSVLLRGLLSAPNAPDVQNYHLPRQLMWLQQGSLDHYLTANDRELMMPPLAELIQAHAMLLSGGDRWAALPQGIAYLVGLLAAGAIAVELGGSERSRTVAAFLAATLPPAYHQASSSKNDLLLAVCVVCAAWAWLRVRRTGSWTAWLGLGLATGLAFGTKSTAVLWLAPLAVLSFFLVVRQPARALLALVCAVALPLPHALRNEAWYGTPLGIHRARDGGAEACERLSVGTVVSNLLRDVSGQFALPSPRANQLLQSAVVHAHAWLGLDPDDPKTTLWTSRYAVIWAPAQETLAAAPALALLVLLCGLFALFRSAPLTASERLLWCALAFMILLVAFAIKWQPWLPRLELPGFLLAAALCARVLDRLPPWAVLAGGSLCFVAWVPAAETATRPLWTAPSLLCSTRWQDYFRVTPYEPALLEPGIELIEKSGARLLQIDNIHNAPYPVMRRLLDSDPVPIRFWGTLPVSRTTPPDAIWASANHRELPLWRSVPGARERFRAVGDSYPWILYLPASVARRFPSAGLPSFVGWSECRGLGEPRILLNGPRPVYVRPVTGIRIMAAFISDGSPLRLEFSFFPGSGGILQLSIDGHLIGTSSLPASNNWLDGAFPLPSLPPGHHILWFTLPFPPAGPPRETIFRRFRLLSP